MDKNINVSNIKVKEKLKSKIIETEKLIVCDNVDIKGNINTNK